METSKTRSRSAIVRRTLRRTGTAVIDLVYPKQCAGCRRRGTWVCPDCRAEVAPFRQPICGGCGIPRELGICRCDEMVPGLIAIRSGAPFSGWLREAILSFKYHDEWARAEHLADELAPVVSAMRPIDALVAVPLHRSRFRDRGYNQSALLAMAVGEALHVPVVAAVVRTRATAQQARLSGPERAINVAGAFALAPGVDPTGLNLVLIDDVVTTGSTLNACADVLAAGRAAMVRAATLARQL